MDQWVLLPISLQTQERGSCKGGSGFVQAVGLLHVFAETWHTARIALLESCNSNGCGSVQVVNVIVAYMCTHEIRGVASS